MSTCIPAVQIEPQQLPAVQVEVTCSPQVHVSVPAELVIHTPGAGVSGAGLVLTADAAGLLVDSEGASPFSVEEVLYGIAGVVTMALLDGTSAVLHLRAALYNDAGVLLPVADPDIQYQHGAEEDAAYLALAGDHLSVGPEGTEAKAQLLVSTQAMPLAQALNAAAVGYYGSYAVDDEGVGIGGAIL